MTPAKDVPEPQQPARSHEPAPPAVPTSGTAPIKTPDPTDTEPVEKAPEIPKVGSRDAPGG